MYLFWMPENVCSLCIQDIVRPWDLKFAVLYDALLDYGVLDEFIYFLALFLSSRLNLWFTVIKLIFVVFVVIRV